MNEISIAVRYNNDLRTVSGRELHKVLQIKTHYALWFDRMRDYGFRENTDFFTVFKNVFREDGRAMPQKQIDHNLTIDMAKQLCMIQRTEIGKRCGTSSGQVRSYQKSQQNENRKKVTAAN